MEELVEGLGAQAGLKLGRNAARGTGVKRLNARRQTVFFAQANTGQQKQGARKK